MSILDNIKAFWPFGDAHDANVLKDTSGRGNDLVPNLRINNCTGELRIAANNTAGQQALAAMKGWGKWNRLLTSAEKAALYTREYWPFATTTSLQDANAYLLLDEADGSASYADASGRGNGFAAVGTTVRVAGPASTDYATRFDSGVYLKNSSPGTDIQSSQSSTTIAGWVNLISKSASQQVFWGQLLSYFDSGFQLYYDGSAADRFCFDCDAGTGKDLSAGVYVIDTVFGSPAAGTWYLLIAEFDPKLNRATLSVNNGERTILNNVLQPMPVPGKIVNGSKFVLNPSGSFATRTSGWDVYLPVNGNCHVSVLPSPDVSIGNNAKTVWGWFNTINPATTQTVAGFYAGTGATTDWVFRIVNSRLYFLFGNELASISVPLTDAGWHLVVAWFNKASNQIHIDIDHGASTAYAAGPATPQAVTGALRFGSDTTGGNANQFQGTLNAWGIAGGVPTQDDLDLLWGNGRGWSIQEPALSFKSGDHRFHFAVTPGSALRIKSPLGVVHVKLVEPSTSGIIRIDTSLGVRCPK